MLPRLVAIFCLLCLAGCSHPDGDILAAGTEAVVVPSGEYAPRLDASSDGSIYPEVKPGVRATIGDDPGFHEVNGTRYPAGTVVGNKRKVKLTLETGPLKGVSGSLAREYLRPLPR